MTVEQSNKPAIRKPRKPHQGVVVRDNRDKTIKVVVEELIKHPRYGKYVRRRTAMHVHDQHNEARVGDLVQIMATRPLSKTKNWRLVKVVRRSKLAQAGGTESQA